MSAEGFEAASADARVVVEMLYRLHSRLLERAQSLLLTLEGPDHDWEVGAEVQGYLARLESGQPEAPGQEAICAQLRADIRRLQLMTEQLEQLRAAVQAPDNP